MEIKIIYEDDDLLVVDKPAGVVVFPEGQTTSNTLIDLLLEQYPDLKKAGEAPRYGIVHRLDKDTSGILLVAKTPEALIFLQKQFSAHTFSSINKKLEERESWDGSASGGKNRETLEKNLEKRYIALVVGAIKDDSGEIKTLIGRSPQDPRKQKAYSLEESAPPSAREAVSDYKVLERFSAQGGSASGGENYTLLEIGIATGRKHQIRCHLAYIHHPVAGDKVYGFKDSPCPDGLGRQFLHASYMKIKLLDGKELELNSALPEDLKKIINELKIYAD